jgi:predicted enzyme related to lactoylglutathione lyase
MPHRDSAPLGAPCWVEIFSSEIDKAREFYGQLFGWTSEAAGEEYGGYVTFSKDGEVVAGGMQNDGSSGAPDFWSVYLASADATATAAAAAANGGQVHLDAMQVGEMGTMAVLGDPGQATIGVWQPASHQGFTVLGEPDTPNWFELHTRDYDDSLKFYETVFGWDTAIAADTPEFRYTTLGKDEAALAGIMDATAFLPEGAPAQWSIYFGTTNADATLAKVVELGGQVVQAAEDTPYGRLATAADITGVHFKLLQPN